MQFNNLTAMSSKDSSRQNSYSFVQEYNSYITRPKFVSLLSASIPVTYLSFPRFKTNLYMNVYGSTYTISVPNGYYDNVTEFLPILQTATNTALGNTSFTWSFSTTLQCLKLSCSSTTTFQIMGTMYNPMTNIAKRLGFIDKVNYVSYIENSVSVLYAEGILKLARTSGFYLVSDLVDTNNCATVPESLNIIDFIPIDHSNISYGDTITVTRSTISTNRVKLTQSEILDASSTFVFQLLDDELNVIDDVDRGGNTVLFLQLDYD